jgi:hypothetical protein
MQAANIPPKVNAKACTREGVSDLSGARLAYFSALKAHHLILHASARISIPAQGGDRHMLHSAYKSNSDLQAW